MAARGTKAGTTLGFLTVVEDSQHGVFGGFLVLNAAGRPLEFHCTTPVKPNRAQEILYGPTLKPYLYGERIGPALIGKAAAVPAVVCVDLPEMLAVRPQVQPPMVLVLGEDAGRHNLTEESSLKTRIDLPHERIERTSAFHVDRHSLAVHEDFASDRELILPHLQSLADFDLQEPFGRIREAIEEAQRGSR